MMTMPDRQTCEAKIESTWRLMSLAEATAQHLWAVKRCPACHGRVSITRTYTGRGELRLVHRKGFNGCPLLPARFNGTPSRHPQALE